MTRTNAARQTRWPRGLADDVTGAFYVADVASPGALVLGFVWLVCVVVLHFVRGG